MPSVLDLSADVTVLLTATVDIKGMPAVSAPDPRQREADYAACLRYNLTAHPRFRRLVFAENSGWPLDRLREEAQSVARGQRIEFLSLPGNDFPRHLGKSYGEMLLIERAMKASALVRRARYVAKLTGRNFCLNLTRVLESMPRPVDFYCDLRDHNFYGWMGSQSCGHHAESRVYLFTPAFFRECLDGKSALLDDSKGYMIENLLYDVAKDPRNARRVIRRFLIEPEFRGTAGHRNKDYGSPREVLKRRVRGMTRRLAPWLHI